MNRVIRVQNAVCDIISPTCEEKINSVYGDDICIHMNDCNWLDVMGIQLYSSWILWIKDETRWSVRDLMHDDCWILNSSWVVAYLIWFMMPSLCILAYAMFLFLSRGWIFPERGCFFAVLWWRFWWDCGGLVVVMWMIDCVMIRWMLNVFRRYSYHT